MNIRNRHPLLSKILEILVAGALLVGYILLTNPNSVPLPLLLVPFVLIGFILYEVTSLAVRVISRDRAGIVPRMLPISVGFIGVALLVLSSLHQLTWKDTLLVILFTALLWMYLWRADFLQKSPKNHN